MIPVKKSFCVFLCVLILFGSIAIVSFAENVPDPANPDNNVSYVEPTADTTLETKGPIENLISKVAGDELVDAGEKHDVNAIMALGEKITAQIRDFFGKLAEFAARISDWFLKLFKIK